jgi:hypothetical protein
MPSHYLNAPPHMLTNEARQPGHRCVLAHVPHCVKPRGAQVTARGQGRAGRVGGGHAKAAVAAQSCELHPSPWQRLDTHTGTGQGAQNSGGRPRIR